MAAQNLNGISKMGTFEISLIILDFILLLVAGILIPIGIKLINCLNGINVTIDNVSEATTALATSLKEISTQLTEAHLRDKDLESRLKSIETLMRTKCEQ